VTLALTPPTVGVDPARVEIDVVPPLDWLLVRLDPPITETDGGIAVPGQAIPPARTGVVVKAGKGMVSEDGVTLLPMHAKVGQRIMFERAAGKGLPRCPKETSERRGWAYLLLRDGSVCAVIESQPVDPARQRALDAGAAGVPARPEGSSVPVSRAGTLSPERLRPVQDWMVVRADLMPEAADPGPVQAPAEVAQPAKFLHLPGKGKGGKAKARPIPPKRVLLREREPEEAYEMWSGTILSRGEGLLTVTRCLDGDRVGRAPRLAEVGSRCLFSVARPFCEQIDPIRGFRPGSEFLMREYGPGGASNVCGVLPPLEAEAG